MGVDEQETVEVAGARMIATAQLFGREADATHAYESKRWPNEKAAPAVKERTHATICETAERCRARAH